MWYLIQRSHDNLDSLYVCLWVWEERERENSQNLSRKEKYLACGSRSITHLRMISSTLKMLSVQENLASKWLHQSIFKWGEHWGPPTGRSAIQKCSQHLYLKQLDCRALCDWLALSEACRGWAQSRACVRGCCRNLGSNLYRDAKISTSPSSGSNSDYSPLPQAPFLGSKLSHFEGPQRAALPKASEKGEETWVFNVFSELPRIFPKGEKTF